MNWVNNERPKEKKMNACLLSFGAGIVWGCQLLWLSAFNLIFDFGEILKV